MPCAQKHRPKGLDGERGLCLAELVQLLAEQQRFRFRSRGVRDGHHSISRLLLLFQLGRWGALQPNSRQGRPSLHRTGYGARGDLGFHL